MPTLTLCALLLTALQPDKPPAKGGVEEAIAAALRNHPDVRVAEANRILADAELEQTKLAVSRRVSAAYAKLEAAKIKYEVRAVFEQRVKNPERVTPEGLQYAATLADAKAELVLAEEEVKSAVGAAKAPGAAAEGVAAALKSHPDIKVAEAKRLVADATLEQARLLVTQRVGAAYSKAQASAAKAVAAVDDHKRALEMMKKNGVPKGQIEQVEARIQVAQAQAEAAAADAELKAVTGGGAKADSDPNAVVLRVLAVDALRAAQVSKVPAATPSGSAADKLRALLDKPIKLDLKAGPFSDIMPEFLKQTGLDAVTVRYPTWASIKYLKTPPTVGPFTGEKTLMAWVELLVDEFQNPGKEGGEYPTNLLDAPYVVVVREYGLLIVGKKSAPPDALTLTEFAKLVRAEKEKGEPKK